MSDTEVDSNTAFPIFLAPNGREMRKISPPLVEAEPRRVFRTTRAVLSTSESMLKACHLILAVENG